MKLTTFHATRNDGGNLINLFIDVARIKNFCEQLKPIIDMFEKVKVAAVIGKSGIGKSTLLNALITKRLVDCRIPIPTDQPLFTSASETENQNRRITEANTFTGCTMGMDTYFMNCAGVLHIFIDVQGITGNETEVEPIVILFCHYISDLIIVNVEDIDVQTFYLLNSISKYNQDFQNASLKHKPHIVYRSTNRSYQMRDSLMQTHYNTMMLPKADSHHTIRTCLKSYFTSTVPPCVWSASPDSETLQKFNRTKDVFEFMKSTNNYETMCKQLLNILDNIPERTNNFTDILLTSAEIINKNFSRLYVNGIEGFDHFQLDEKMSQWFHNEISEMGRYRDLLKQPKIEDCTEESYVLLKNREHRIQMCKEEFKSIFAGSANLEKGLESFAHIIESWFQKLQAQFDSYVRNIVADARNYIKEELKKIPIASSKSEWMDMKSFNELANTSIDKHLVANEVLMKIFQNFKAEYQKVSDKFAEHHEHFYANLRTTVDNCRKLIRDNKQNITNRINVYASRLDVSYSEITDLLLNEIQEEFLIIFDHNIVTRLNIFDVERKTKLMNIDENCNKKILLPIPYFTPAFDNNNELRGLKETTVGLDYVDIPVTEHNIFVMFEDLRKAYDMNKNKFDTLRKKSIPEALRNYNSKPYNERLEIFESINSKNDGDLYLIETDFINSENIGSQIFRNHDENLHIMTLEVFKARFGETFTKWYKLYKTLDNEREKRYIRDNIWDKYMDEYLNVKYRQLKIK